jgi:hypothetical protein
MVSGLDAVIGALQRLIADLSRPLSEEDRREGWTEALQRDWRQHFVELETRLRKGEAPEGDQYHLMRWLNFDGLGLGPLADQIRPIQRQLWDLFASDEARYRAKAGTTGRKARRFLRDLQRGRFPRD